MASRLSTKAQSDSPTSVHLGTMPSTSEAAIWSRLIDPTRADLTADAAESLLRIRWSEEDAKRAHELTTKNQEASLTPEERAELENYCRVGRVLDLMHSKARRSLKRSSH